jgi:hypothetical protein
LNNSSDASQNDSFVFSAAQYKSTTTTDGNVITVSLWNAFDLNASYFKTKIIEASALGKLSGNDVFKEYFRGLYFKVEKK